MRRTPLTWALYGSAGAWASFVYLTGPVAPVLAEDLGIGEASVGLVGTALAAGIATAAATGPPLAARLGRDGTVKLGLAVLASAAAFLAAIPRLMEGWPAFALVLTVVWIGAVGGATCLNVGTARLSELHPEDSGAAITEANAVAAWTGLFSPLLLGAALGAGLGWWAGFVICLAFTLVALTALVLVGRRALEPSTPDTHPHHTMTAADELYERSEDVPVAAQSSALPRTFWIVMIALFAAAASEFAINFWGSTLIVESTGASTSAATASMSAIVAGLAVGRTIGPRVTALLGAHGMLVVGFPLALVGFMLLWTASALPVAVVGLFVAGLGLATLFPLIIDRGIAVSNGQPDLALARASLILGLAIGGAPFLLGSLGSVMSVSSAMLLVPILVVLGLIGVLGSRPRPT